MSKSEIEKIKAILSDINEQRDKAFNGAYEYDNGIGVRENACAWLEFEEMATNKITSLTKALEIAVEALALIERSYPLSGERMAHQNHAENKIKQISEILVRK